MSEGYRLPPSRLKEGDHHKQLVAVVVEEVTSTNKLNYFYLTIPNVLK